MGEELRGLVMKGRGTPPTPVLEECDWGISKLRDWLMLLMFVECCCCCAGNGDVNMRDESEVVEAPLCCEVAEGMEGRGEEEGTMEDDNEDEDEDAAPPNTFTTEKGAAVEEDEEDDNAVEDVVDGPRYFAGESERDVPSERPAADLNIVPNVEPRPAPPAPLPKPGTAGEGRIDAVDREAVVEEGEGDVVGTLCSRFRAATTAAAAAAAEDVEAEEDSTDGLGCE